MRVDIKRSWDPQRMAQKASEAADDLPYDMWETVDVFIQEEQNTKSYVNRTNDAIESTRAEITERGPDVEVVAYMDAVHDGFPYTLWLQEHGYSNFDDLMDQAKSAVDKTVAHTFRFLFER